MNSITTQMSCSYPECSNLIWVTVEQKRELKTYHYLKYGKTVDVYCSKECQEKHLKDLTEAGFLIKGTLKNHEYALIVHGADVSKRLKEKEVHVITGNKTEQRLRCLRDELLSVTTRTIRLHSETIKGKFMYPIEIQEFIKNKLPENLKVSDGWIHVAASEFMTKCAESYPNEISIERVDDKTRVLLYINGLL